MCWVYLLTFGGIEAFFLKTLIFSYPEIRSTYTSQASKIFSAVADSAWREQGRSRKFTGLINRII